MPLKKESIPINTLDCVPCTSTQYQCINTWNTNAQPAPTFSLQHCLGRCAAAAKKKKFKDLLFLLSFKKCIVISSIILVQNILSLPFISNEGQYIVV